MRIVLTGPEIEENLSLRYLEGALRAERHEVRIVPFASPQEIERAALDIAGSGAQVAGFSMVFTRRAREFARLVARCREVGYSGLTIAGGHFASFNADELMRDLPQLDAIAIGEGEGILCDIARGVEPLGRIRGLVIRDGDAVVRTGPAETVEDLDTLAWPVHRRPFDRYMGLPLANMLGSRGCTHSCAFCSISAWHRMMGGSRHRRRSAAGIAAEMGCLAREGVRLFNFHDDNFLCRSREENLARAGELRDELRRQGVGKIAFQIKARPDEVDLEVFSLLRSMGLFRVFLGIEAGTETSLRNLGRGQKLADNVRALGILDGLDLHVGYNLLVLNPESTFEDFAGNVAFLREHPANPMNFCRTEIYQGTPLERRLGRQGRLLGSYWGLDYAIADERAQMAFELMRDAFFDRNFGPWPLHYLTNQVDYEHQLRMDFIGTTPALRALAKGYVRTVNLNTVGHLEQVIDAVRQGTDLVTFKKALFERVRADDIRLHAEGQALLVRIRDVRRSETRPRPAAAQLAVAAAVAISLAACGAKRDTAVMEAAPPPPDLSIGGPPDADADPDMIPQAMEAAPYWEKPYIDAPVLGADLAPDASTDPVADPSKDPKPLKDAATKADIETALAKDPSMTAPMEAAPPPPYDDDIYPVSPKKPE